MTDQFETLEVGACNEERRKRNVIKPRLKVVILNESFYTSYLLGYRILRINYGNYFLL